MGRPYPRQARRPSLGGRAVREVPPETIRLLRDEGYGEGSDSAQEKPRQHEVSDCEAWQGADHQESSCLHENLFHLVSECLVCGGRCFGVSGNQTVGPLTCYAN